tara:strand:- start:5279 stop:6361 length:1083 start_codon:yes stop_codon:yes gene_type:complete
MKMFTNKKPINCHIELTNHCNAACPMCGRNIVKGVWPHHMSLNPRVNSHDLSISDIKKIFDDKFFKTYNLKKMNMCGNRGDPASSKDLFETCEYLFGKASSDFYINIATNGGLKTPDYWKKLGKVFSSYNKKSKVTFGLDGLKDTNHIYRQNVNFDKVMQNAQAFIDSGGNAFWQYLIFKHNQHQVEEARKLSEDMGFAGFFVIHTPRFQNSQKKDGKKIFTYKNKTWTIESADPDWDKNVKIMNYIDDENDKGEIDCKAHRTNEFYIDCRGRLTACCWLGGSLDWTENRPNRYRDQILKLYDEDDMNVINNDLVRTLQHRFLTKDIPLGWKNLENAYTCKRFCTKNKNLQKVRQGKFKI